MKNREWIVYYGILIFAVILILCSCNPVKRVLADPKKMEKVGRAWEKQNPCYRDTIIFGEETIKIDTVLNQDTTIITDTVINNDTIHITKRYYNTITKNHHHYKKETVVDIRRINLLERDLAFANGQLKQSQANTTAATKRGNGFMWLWVGTLAAIVAYAVWRIRNKLKIKL